MVLRVDVPPLPRHRSHGVGGAASPVAALAAGVQGMGGEHAHRGRVGGGLRRRAPGSQPGRARRGAGAGPRSRGRLQEFGQAVHGGMVKAEGGGKLQSQRVGQPALQLQRPHRVQARLAWV